MTLRNSNFWLDSYSMNIAIPLPKMRPTGILSYQQQQHKRHDRHSKRSRTTTIYSNKSNRMMEIPLFDLSAATADDDNNKNIEPPLFVQPLPSIHLQHLSQHEELVNDLHVYGMKLTIPLQQQIIQHAWDVVDDDTNPNTSNNNDDDVNMESDPDMFPIRKRTTLKPYNDPTKVPLVGVVAYTKPTSKSVSISDNDDDDDDDGMYIGGSSSETKQQQHPYIGAIGCVVELIHSESQQIQLSSTGSKESAKKKKTLLEYNTPSTSKTVICRGIFRFIVRDIKQSIPYVVAIVEELNDDNDTGNNNWGDSSIHDDLYTNMTASELMQRTLQSTQRIIEQMSDQADRLQQQQASLTPLEESILQDNGMMLPKERHLRLQEMVQEYRKIYNYFYTVLIDDMIQPTERYYAVPMFVSELLAFNNTVRQQILCTTSPIERLRIVCRVVSDLLSSSSFDGIGGGSSILLSPIDLSKDSSTSFSSVPTNTFAPSKSIPPPPRPSQQTTINYTNDDDDVSDAIKDIIGNSGSGGSSNTGISKKDLRVGTPTLPLWSKQIKKGTVLEYYWNEEYGWCRGQVMEDPLRIVVDEMILTVQFFDDETTHRLPFSADEKVRWRPPTNPSTFA